MQSSTDSSLKLATKLNCFEKETVLFPSKITNVDMINTATLEEIRTLEPIYIKKKTFIKALKKWIISFKVSQRAVNSLLNILKAEGFNLPKDCITLLQTNSNKSIVSASVGFYNHIGLENGIKYMFKQYHNLFFDSINELHINFNFDGLPLNKSSGYQFWPILCTIANIYDISKKPIIAGLYYGMKKPNNLKAIMHTLDAINVIKKGII